MVPVQKRNCIVVPQAATYEVQDKVFVFKVVDGEAVVFPSGQIFANSGEINIGPIAVTATGTDTITIEETKAPDGYEKIITAPITVQVTKVFENNTYKMSTAQITNAQTGASLTLSGNTITVTVENKLIPKTSEYNLKLIKVEEGTSNKLEGAEFKINSPNGEVTQTTNASGEINIGPIAFVVCVTSPFGEFILNSAPSSLLLVPSSTFISFKLYSLVLGISLFSTVTVIVFPDNVKLAPVCAFVICAVDILYVLFSNTFVTCTVIGAVIIFS